jgi:tetratricopeptide (TPR) repeat protein
MVRVATIDPELEYLFRHWLIQEAAYGSLLKQERRQLHLTAGETLERLYPDRLGELSAQLAQHFDVGGDDARALDYLVKAGRHALDRTAYQEARAFLDRAAVRLADQPDDDATRRVRVEVALYRVQSGWSFTPPDENLAIIDRAVADAEKLGDDRLLVDVYTWVGLMRQMAGEQAATSPALKHALARSAEIAARLDDESIQAMPLAMSGMALVAAGELRRGVEILERATPLLRKRRMTIAASFVGGGLATAYAQLGEFDKARLELQRSLDDAVDGDPIAHLDARLAEGFIEIWGGNMEKALAIGTECDARADELGAFACAVASKYIKGAASLEKGDLEQARAELEASKKMSQISLMQGMRPMILAALGTAYARLGAREQALQSWSEGLEFARHMGDRPNEAAILLHRGRTIASDPDPDWDAALADFEASVGLFEEMEILPDLVRALEALGEGLKRAGREDEGARRLAQAAGLKTVSRPG